MDGDWGFLSSLAFWKDGTLCKANIQKKGVFTFVNSKDYRADLVPVYMAAMTSLYLNAEAVRTVGLPIAEYYLMLSSRHTA